MSNISIEEAVANGVRWMNENLGEDWPDFIDRETLDLNDGSACILGQTFEGGYSAFVASPFLTGYYWREGHGFTAVPGKMADLQAEWEKYLDEYEPATA